MEFATEMVIKSSLMGVRIAEVPITLHRDGRQAHAPHLKTFTDGWCTLRFFMLYSPRWLYLVPGVIFLLLGLAGYALALAVHQWWQADFGRLDYARTMRLVIPGVTLCALGFQSVMGAFFISILGLRRK